MALTFDQLQQLLKGEKLNYYIAPDRPVARFSARGYFGTYGVIVQLQDEGRFLQFRSVDYFTCTQDHPHLNAVLRTIAGLNFATRLRKIGWDARDGELAAYADHWVMDGTLTQAQFYAMLHTFVPTIDEDYRRIKATSETGQDPGPLPSTPAPAQGPATPPAGGPIEAI